MAESTEGVPVSAMTPEKAITLISDSARTTKIGAWFLIVFGFLFSSGITFLIFWKNRFPPNTDIYLSLGVGAIFFGIANLYYAIKAIEVKRLSVSNFSSTDFDLVKIAKNRYKFLIVSLPIFIAIITLLFWNRIGPVPFAGSVGLLGYSFNAGSMVWFHYLEDEIAKRINK